MIEDRSHSALHVLRQLDDAGIRRVDDDTAALAFNSAAQLGFNAWRIDLGRVGDEAMLFKALARSLRFPEWFGHNWDALADCLTDLAWCEASGYVLVIQRLDHLADTAPATCGALLDVLRDAAGIWRQDGVPFWVFVTGSDEDKPTGLPRLQLHT